MADLADITLAGRIREDIYAPARDTASRLEEYGVWT
jgi:hypothetical protein